MSEEPKDYDEHVIPDPTPINRLVDWCKGIWATKKLLLAVWTFFFGVSGTALVGNYNETNPWKLGETAEQQPQPEPIVPRETIPAHSHEQADCVCPAHTHPVPAHTHPELQNLLPENHLELH